MNEKNIALDNGSTHKGNFRTYHPARVLSRTDQFVCLVPLGELLKFEWGTTKILVPSALEESRSFHEYSNL